MLVRINSSNNIKIAVLLISIDETSGKIIKYTGTLGKPIIQRPIILIKKTKYGKTIEEQISLKLNSIIEKYKTRGYFEIKYKINKISSFGIPIIDENEIRSLIVDKLIY